MTKKKLTLPPNIGRSISFVWLTGRRIEEIHDAGSIGEVGDETIISINGRVSSKKISKAYSHKLQKFHNLVCMDCKLSLSNEI